MENRESTREQLLKAGNLADLVGEILEKYIEAKVSVIAENSGEMLADNEKLLQEVDRYRYRFADIIAVLPWEKEEYRELKEKVEYWQELKDE